MDAPEKSAAKPTRKAEALAFITAYLTRTNTSPSIGDIAAALGVGPTRAKNLVHALARDRTIERAPGAHRAISVPGLFDQLVKDRLRAEGWIVDEDARRLMAGGPQGHLPLVAILDHIPDVLAGDGDDRSDVHEDGERHRGGRGRPRGAARRAPGARPAPPETGEERAA